MKRLLVVTAVALVLLALQPLSPASAVDSVNVQFIYASAGTQSQQEIQKWTPRPDSVIRGEWRVVVDASTNSSLQSFKVEIVPETSGIPALGPQALTSRSFDLGQTSSHRLTLPWDTTTLTPRNASYRIVARATSHVGTSAQSQVVGVIVDNPPAVPTGADAELVGGAPRITWDPNPEADLLHYHVLRSAGTLGFSKIVTLTSTSFSDTGAPKGVSLRYEVIAVRRSLVSKSGIASSASQPTERLVIPRPVTEEDGPPPAAQIAPPQPGEVRAVEGREVVGARRDVGFEPTLPYSDDASVPPPYNFSDDSELTYAGETSAAPQPGLQLTVHKPPFVAAALLLIGIAAHLALLSRRLLRD